MRRRWAGVATLVLLASAGCAADRAGASAAVPGAAHLEIRRAGAQPSRSGAAGNFTGSVTVTQLFGATDRARASGGSVTFAPGARSVWHTHPVGQTLIVTSGTGWVQEWGGPKQEIKAGDVVWTPPGVKHWHGATATLGMTHIAVQEHVDGSVVRWMEPVTDEQYRSEERHP